MAIIESHQSKNRKVCPKVTRLAKKGYSVSSRPTSEKHVVFMGGVVHVQIRSTRTADGGYDINLKKVASRTKNTHGVFVAGGTEVDRLVASANASVPLPSSNVIVHKKKLASLKDYFFHRKP